MESTRGPVYMGQVRERSADEWTGGLSKSHSHPSSGGVAALPTSHNSILHFHTALGLLDSIRRRKREMERWKETFFLYRLLFLCSTSSSRRGPSKAASLLFLYPLHLGKITLWIAKGTPGPLTQASPFPPPLRPLPSLWIIDSCCLVIHRLHMPANSSGGGKLPGLATLRSTSNMHTTNHASRSQTHTPQVWVKPRHTYTPPPRPPRPAP